MDATGRQVHWYMDRCGDVRETRALVAATAGLPAADMALATQFSSLKRLPTTEHEEENSFTYAHHFSPIPWTSKENQGSEKNVVVPETDQVAGAF